MQSSLRTRLILNFISLTTIPLLVVGLVFVQRSIVVQEEQALILQSQVAQKTASEVSAFIAARENELRLLSKVQNPLLLEQAEQIELLDSFLIHQKEYEEITLLDSTGNELLHRSRLGTQGEQREVIIWSSLAKFTQPVISGEIYYSPVEVNEYGVPHMTISLPVFDLHDNTLSYLLIARFRFKKIWNLMIDASNSSQTVYILDSQGTLVAHPNPSIVLRGTQFDIADKDGFTIGLDGSDVAQATTRIPLGEETLIVVAEQLSSTALKLSYNVISLTAIAIVVGLLFSIVFGFLAAQRIVQPVEALAETTQIISDGDLSQKVDVDSDDEIGMLAAAFNQMTERLRELVGELEQNEENLRTILNSIGDAVIATDGDGLITYANPVSEQLTGWELEHVVGKPLTDVFHILNSQTREPLVDPVTRVLESKKIIGLTNHTLLVSKNGTEYQIANSAAPIIDSENNVTGVVLVFRDVSEEYQMREALRESEQRQRDLLNNTSSVIYIKDLDGKYLFVNQVYERLFHVSEEEIKGMTDHDKFPSEVADIFRANDLKAIEAGEPLEFEEKVFQDDGEHTYISVKFPLKHNSGKVYAVCGISTDITMRKQTEQERENLITEMEAKNAELERFTYTVSHDLKSPLVTINGFLGYLKEDAASGNMDRLDRDTQRIHNAVRKMQRLLDELLELSRIGRMLNDPQQVPFNELVTDAIANVQGQLDKRNITVQILEGEQDLPSVYVDRQRMVEVMQNLLENAAKYMGDQSEPSIEVGQQGDENGMPIFFVRDNGMGISPEFHERIFGLFNKLDTNQEGTGVGLALVKRIIEFHSGRIWVESELGEGATFYFTLPIA